MRVRDVASLDGPDASSLGDLVVVDAASRKASGGASAKETVSTDDLRAAFDRAGVNLGRIRLGGSTCTIRSATPQPASPSADPKSSPKDRPAPEVVDVSSQPTVRVLIARRLAALYSVEPSDLRLRFIPTSPEDESLLTVRTDDGRRFEVSPGGSSLSGRLGARVEIYSGDRLVLSRAIGIEALVRREACIATASVARGDVVTDADIEVESRWIAPSTDAPPVRTAVVGQSARRRIEPGRVIGPDDIRPAIMVERGDEVSVHTLSGGIVLKSKARATEQGREGDMIDVRREGSKKSFLARVSATGLVVVNLDGSAEPSPATSSRNEPIVPAKKEPRDSTRTSRRTQR